MPSAAADGGGDCFSVALTASPPSSSGTVDTGVTLVWDDLRVSVPSRDKHPPKLVLSGVSGSARSGRLLAVMGSSGAGKSCLLDALAGRSKGTHVSGSVRLHGASSPDPTKTSGSGVSYVPEDILLNSATVEETFATAILLRLGPITQEELNARVDTTIRDLKLEAVRTSLIGGADIRGISGGEKRRVSIGQEMCSNANAPVLLTDEPTSGLDSRTAEFVMRTLIELAQSKGTIVIATIHQPNSLITAMFDDLLLLDRGRCAYFGPARGAVAWFESAGFPCPLNWNPTDHFLSVLDDAASADKLVLALGRGGGRGDGDGGGDGGGAGDGGGDSDETIMLQAGATVTQQRPTTSLLHQAQVLALRNARQWLHVRL